MRGDTKPQNLSSAMPARNAEKHGAPRPTKMCNIASLWRYDVRADHTLKRENMRPSAILRCAHGRQFFHVKVAWDHPGSWQMSVVEG